MLVFTGKAVNHVGFDGRLQSRCRGFESLLAHFSSSWDPSRASTNALHVKYFLDVFQVRRYPVNIPVNSQE